MSDNVQVKGKRNLPVQIDRALIERDGKDIGVYGFAIYGALCLFENMPEITPSIATLGGFFNISRNTVKDALLKLEAAGWLKVEHRYDPLTKVNHTSVYHLLQRPDGVGHQMTEGRSPEGQYITAVSSNGDGEQKTLGFLWSKLTGGNVNPLHLDLLDEYEERFGYVWVFEAMKSAASSKSAIELRNLHPSYLLSIMTRWQREGVDPTVKVDPVPQQNALFESWRTVY